MKKNNLAGKRILITGISGFIGSHVAEGLEKQGAVVIGTSRRFSDKKRHIYQASLLELDVLEKIVTNEKITTCIHLAADALVESGQESPYETFRTNIDSSLTILELARKHNFEKVIITSTSHVYGKNKLPFKEYYSPKPSRPYETSKACVDLIAQSYADSFDLPVLIPRFVNIYGPGDTHLHRLVPKTIHSILTENTVHMWGGNIVRDFLYIDDVVNAYSLLLRHQVSLEEKSNRIFNFGSGNRIPISELITKLIAISKKDIIIKKIGQTRLAEIKTQYISFTKAKKLLHWEPSVDLQSGLKKTFAWYKNHINQTTYT